jgi:hypothetical protein
MALIDIKFGADCGNVGSHDLGIISGSEGLHVSTTNTCLDAEIFFRLAKRLYWFVGC